MPIPEYRYRKNASTATDRKNMYGLTVLYTQPKGKTRLARSLYAGPSRAGSYVLGQIIAI